MANPATQTTQARDGQAARRPHRRVVVVVFPRMQLLDLSGPHEVLAAASDLARTKPGVPVYRVELVAARRGLVRSESGLGVEVPNDFSMDLEDIDTLMVVGGMGTIEAHRDAATVDFVRRAAAGARRITSICTGTYVLAAAGLLAGRRVTTHWGSTEHLAASYPELEVDPDPIYVRDGNVWTSAGVTSGMDLALALVEDDHGRDVALSVARRLVLFLKRPGGQSQFSAQLETQMAERAPLKDLQTWIADHPAHDLSVAALARRVAMSPRHFARVFAEEVGTTPARFVERTRVEAARRLLEDTDAGVDGIAAKVGFGSPETMRRAFLRAVGVAPTAYRSRFQGVAPVAVSSRRRQAVHSNGDRA